MLWMPHVQLSSRQAKASLPLEVLRSLCTWLFCVTLQVQANFRGAGSANLQEIWIVPLWPQCYSTSSSSTIAIGDDGIALAAPATYTVLDYIDTTARAGCQSAANLRHVPPMLAQR